MTPLKTRILIADDHPVVLRGLRIVLNAQPDLEVIADASDGDQAVTQALLHDVHLAILDISMPRKTGLQAAREITHRKPQTRVLMLSMHDNEQYLFEAISAGASGYVLKSAVDRDLVEACRATMRGQPFVCPAGIRALMRDYLERARTGDTHRELLTRARMRSSSSSPKPTPTTRSASCCTSPRRPSNDIARTSSRSSACATVSSSPGTRSAAASSPPE
jgi:DNA-binding NarL/FixJ family response regulator